MKLVIEDKGIVWEPDEILWLAQRALEIAKEDPAGAGTHLDPFTMTRVEQWYKASVEPPPMLKRAFYVVGGRLLHRRLNRAQAKYSDYITECGPWNTTTRDKIDVARQGREKLGLKVSVQPTTDQNQTERFDNPARWYTRPGSGVEDDSDLKGLGGVGPSYNSLEDAIKSFLSTGQDTSVALARSIRGCLDGSETKATASVACLTTAWFIGEVKRHPRSLLSALILLDMIEGRHSADSKDLFHGDVFTFDKVISKQSTLPHPMSGKGTVDKAFAAQKRTTALDQTVDKAVQATHSDDPIKIDFKVKRGGNGLNNVETRESEIMIRWLARRLYGAGHYGAKFDNGKDTRDNVRIKLEGEKLYYSGVITAQLWQRLSSFAPMV